MCVRYRAVWVAPSMGLLACYIYHIETTCDPAYLSKQFYATQFLLVLVAARPVWRSPSPRAELQRRCAGRRLDCDHSSGSLGANFFTVMMWSTDADAGWGHFRVRSMAAESNGGLSQEKSGQSPAQIQQMAESARHLRLAFSQSRPDLPSDFCCLGTNLGIGQGPPRAELPFPVLT